MHWQQCREEGHEGMRKRGKQPKEGFTTGGIGPGRKPRSKGGSQGPREHRSRAAVLLFKADVSQVSVIDTDDTVILLEEALLVGLASLLQTLDQQAKSPEKVQKSKSTQCKVMSVDSMWLLCCSPDRVHYTGLKLQTLSLNTITLPNPCQKLFQAYQISFSHEMLCCSVASIESLLQKFIIE